MYPRLAVERLQHLAQQFPAVLILGARQVGKTTLARTTFPEFPYCDLEDPHLVELFVEDARFQVESRIGAGIVLDEAQNIPTLFPVLRGLIDTDRRAGRFILLGSAQPDLVRGVSESLAGRVGLLDLDPLTGPEATQGDTPQSWQRLWLAGGFPDALAGDFREWHEAYLRTYLERDLPMLGLGAEPLFLRRLLTMLAHQQGGLFNASALAKSLGVSVGKITRMLDILEQTFLIRRLPPYFRNVGKRLTKSPKVYLRDTGLLHHLLNISTWETLEAHPIRGASWETLVLEDLIRRERLRHPNTQAYFWRTQAGAEIDLLLERGGGRVALEVKAGRGNARHARHLDEALNDAGASAGWILDQGQGTEPLRPRITRKGFQDALDWLPDGGGL